MLEQCAPDPATMPSCGHHAPGQRGHVGDRVIDGCAAAAHDQGVGFNDIEWLGQAAQEIREIGLVGSSEVSGYVGSQDFKTCLPILASVWSYQHPGSSTAADA